MKRNRIARRISGCVTFSKVKWGFVKHLCPVCAFLSVSNIQCKIHFLLESSVTTNQPPPPKPVESQCSASFQGNKTYTTVVTGDTGLLTMTLAVLSSQPSESGAHARVVCWWVATLGTFFGWKRTPGLPSLFPQGSPLLSSETKATHGEVFY
jgi:hypothetical protein